MGLRKSDRDEALAFAAAHPDEHMVYPAEVYTKDGRILVEVDGLRVSLHRWLYQSLIGTLGDRDFLLPDCGVSGCQQPAHSFLSPSPWRPGKARPRERSLRGGLAGWQINALKIQCPQGHPFSPENTYIWVDRKGRSHRKCRTCTITRALAQTRSKTKKKRAEQ